MILGEKVAVKQMVVRRLATVGVEGGKEGASLGQGHWSYGSALSACLELDACFPMS